MNSLEQFMSDQLKSRLSKGSLRRLKIADPALKDFTSNDYLGLARSEDLREKIANKIDKLAMRNGATGSRLLSGNSSHHQKLEEQLKEVFISEACLVYNSGYAANLGVLSALPSRHDTILYDELCHASIKDGIRLSLATKHSFKHNDTHDLEEKIVRAKGKVFVVAESIYSMDGDLCPLVEIVALTEKHNCFLILDEAHSTGIMGDGGAGLAVSLNLHKNISVRIYTFGKAMGSHGACVAGSKNLIEYLVNFSRPFIYTTALPDHTIIGLSESFDFIKQRPELQVTLKSRIETFRDLFRKTSSATTPIQTVVFDSVEKTVAIANRLQVEGFDVRPILAPTVPEGKERLRICLHAFNSDKEIFELFQELNKQ